MTERGPNPPPVPDWWSLKSRFSYDAFDLPPHSRLFLVLAEKVMTPNVWLRLSSFGPIEDFWPQLDKRNRVPTGAAFVKFARSSDALRALEEIGSLCGWEPGVSKICLAQSRVSRKSGNLNPELLPQIHARVPTTCTEKSVQNVFKVYGDIVSCNIERNKTFGECEVLACIKFSKASEAALAIEQCDKSYNATWADVGTDLPESSEPNIPTDTDKSSSLNAPVTKLTVSTGVKSHESKPEQETAICEVQGKSLNTSDKSSTLKTPVTKPTVSTGVESHETRPEQETAICEVQGKTLNTSEEHISSDEPVMKPPAPPEQKALVISAKKETISCEVKGSSSIPVVCKTTSVESVTKTSESDTHKACVSETEQQTTIHRIQGSNLIVLGSVDRKITEKPLDAFRDRSFMNRAQQNASTVRESNLITLAGDTTLSEPTVKSSECSIKRNRCDISATSNVLTLGHKIMENPFDALRDRSFMNRAQQNASALRESNLITLAGDTTLSEPAAKSAEYSVKRSKWDVAATSNVLTLGCNTSEVEPVSTPPELYGYGSYVGSTVYNSILPVSLTEPLASNLHYYCAGSVEQQTDTQRIQENSLIIPDKSLKSSERKFYMGGRKTRNCKVQRKSLLASVDPPDLASVERSNSRRQASISKRLLVVSKSPLIEEQIFSLFNVVPGLECCETPPHLYNNHVFAVIRYKNIASAVYAKFRLHGIEYPLGNQLHVSFLESETHETNLIQEMATQVVTSQLVSVICKNNWAPQLLASSKSRIPSPSLQTDAELPSRKRKAPPDSAVREKLFIVFDPCPLPQDVLDNVLSRFENFINSHLIPGENVAYAKFAERASASHAIATLHGKTVNGVKLKVILADLPTGL